MWSVKIWSNKGNKKPLKIFVLRSSLQNRFLQSRVTTATTGAKYLRDISEHSLAHWLYIIKLWKPNNCNASFLFIYSMLDGTTIK